jgi:2'-5' RNA ligase
VTTIGVSVAVPDPWGSELQTYRVKLGDEEAAGIPSHITLLPPIDVDDDLMPRIEAHLEHMAVTSESFEAHLRGTGTFRPISPVVFVNVVRGISGFELLALAVRQGPLAIEAHFPYHPHVTVAHDLDEDSLDQAFEDLGDFECRFMVEHFSLYVHDEGQGWTPVRHFTLSRGRSTQGS